MAFQTADEHKKRDWPLCNAGVKIRCLLSILFLFTAFSSATYAQKVKVGYDKGADFTKYKTYTWAPPSMPPTRPILYRQVIGNIDEHLKAKGFTRIDEGGDLIVAAVGGVDFGINMPVGTPILPTYSGPPPLLDAGMWVGASGFSGGAAPLVPEGTLLLEFVDQRANRVVWGGTVNEKLDSDKRIDSLKRVDRAMAKLLSKFPPERKK
jgi:hypothetical protein